MPTEWFGAGRIAGALIGLRGLFLLGNGYRGISLNDCVIAAHAVADAILTPACSKPARTPA